MTGVDDLALTLRKRRVAGRTILRALLVLSPAPSDSQFSDCPGQKGFFEQ